MGEDRTKKSILESMLFLSGEPILPSSLKEIVDISDNEIKRLMEELAGEYRERNAGLLITEVAGGYQMVTNPEYAEWVKRFRVANVASRLSIPALETMAIIAYKQPIIRAEIEQLRGVSSDSAIRTLLERRLIKIMGRKDVPGRPFLYGTTREFLQYFGLKDLTGLPTLKEFIREEAA
jgi:segregation and condensation protein B